MQSNIYMYAVGTVNIQEHFTTTSCLLHSENILQHSHVQSSRIYRVVNDAMWETPDVQG